MQPAGGPAARPLLLLGAALLAVAGLQQALAAPAAGPRAPPRQRRAATARADRLWDEAVIPYEIDAIFNEQRASLFRAAMRHWENFTCIKFVERQASEHPNYIVFTERSCGCCSFVGKRGNGAQAISIGKHCDKFGIVVHELGHVVGFWHEHTRPDRDHHVQIIGRNIMAGQEYNFNKLTRDEVNSLGLAYDYDSILHYATNTFAKDTYLETILPLHGQLNTEEAWPVQTVGGGGGAPAPLGAAEPPRPAPNASQQQQMAGLSLQLDLSSMLDFNGSSRPEAARAGPHERPAGLQMDAPELMISMDNLLAKTRPEIGQRVRLSVGDIAQTNLLYRCPKCGRTIQQPSGILQAPAGGQHQFCEWRLSGAPGERILLNVTDLDIQRPAPPAQASAPSRGSLLMAECQQSDYLEVRDGYTYRAPLVARLCGNISALRELGRSVIVSSSNRLLISYASSQPGRRGFLAHHEAVCGGRLLLGSPAGLGQPVAATTTAAAAAAAATTTTTTTATPPQSPSTTTAPLATTGAPPPRHHLQPKLGQANATSASPAENEVLLSSQTVSSLQAQQLAQVRQFATELGQQSQQPTGAEGAQPQLATNQSGQLRPSGQPLQQQQPAAHLHQAGAWIDQWPIVNSKPIQSPNWPESYRPSRECLWLVEAEENHQISLRFDSFELEQHDSCAYDYLEVRDGNHPAASLIGRFCGPRMPEQIFSSGPQMWIKFVSDSDVNKAGFLASLAPELDECKLGTHGCSYKCSNVAVPYRCECPAGLELGPDGKSCVPLCGGLRNDSRGRISSPSFPDLYPISTRCLWDIQAPQNHRIVLNFSHFDLEGIRGQECDYDYVSVSSRPLGVGQVEWKQHQLEQQHQLEHQHQLDQQQQPQSGAAKYIKNGVYCGQMQPFVVISLGNSVRLEFNSDNSIQKSGFELNYSIDRDECATNNAGCQHLCTNTLGSYQCSCNNGFLLHENGHDCVGSHCLHSITQAEGTFQSPNYPQNYQANRECAWIFSTAPGHRIKLSFDQFELESHQECAYDHVAIYDGEGTNDHALGRFCGSRRPLTIVSSFNMLYMIFRSDATNEKRGFNATHSTICGGRLQANLDQVDHIYSHPQFDGSTHYNRNEDCDWIIETAAELQRIKLEFVYFSLEADANCNYDQALVYDGPDDSSNQLARLCGSELPKEQLKFISSGESMLISFKSDDSINGKGFSLIYTAVEQQKQQQQPTLGPASAGPTINYTSGDEQDYYLNGGGAGKVFVQAP